MNNMGWTHIIAFIKGSNQLIQLIVQSIVEINCSSRPCRLKFGFDLFALCNRIFGTMFFYRIHYSKAEIIIVLQYSQ